MKNKRLDKQQLRKTLISTLIFFFLIVVVFAIFALKAYAACAHQYVNGNCIHCGISCQSCDNEQGITYSYVNFENTNRHVVYQTCSECGLQTSYMENCNFDSQGICVNCDHRESTDCLHSFVFGECLNCGYKCRHPYFSDGVCQFCDMNCLHSNIDLRYIQSSVDSHKHDLAPYCADCDVGYLPSHPDASKTESCTYDQGKCTKCDRYCLHELGFENGKCTICNYGCSHGSGSYYTYTPLSNAVSTHVVRAYCNICRIRLNTSSGYDPLDGAYVTCTFIDGTCTYCKRTCGHSYKTSYEQLPNDYSQHKTVLTCTICDSVTSSYSVHYYDMRNICQHCNLECTHERWTNGICTYCKAYCPHSSYTNGNCDVCGSACEHANTTKTYSQSPNDYALHKEIVFCNSCKMEIDTLLVDHTYYDTVCTGCKLQCTHERWENGKCRYCFMPCEHLEYVDSVCTTCNLKCDHPSIYCRVVGSEKNHQQFYCSTCDFVSKLYEIPYSYTQYFSYVPSPCSWNSITSVMIEKSENSKFDRYFERYMIDKFVEANDYNASAHIIGGSNIKESMAFDAPIKASRYLVLRVRLSGIKHLQVYAYGGNTPVSFSDVVSECSSVHIYDVENLPDGEWTNLVIDLTMFDDVDNSTYIVDTSISHAFISLCFTYASSESFADIEYFSLCDELSDVDLVNNFFSYNSVSNEFYLADGEHSVNLALSHFFDNSDRCQNCGYVCPHVDEYTYDVSNNTSCGSETHCSLCNILLSSTVKPHLFSDNDNTCVNCSFYCDHRYSSGICIYCEWSCAHVHLDGSIKCSNCGFYVDYKGYDDKGGFFALFTAIYDAQANTFFKMLGYEILGVNIAGLIVSVVALAIVIWILKKVL